MVLVVASPRIVALLFLGRRTIYYRFKVLVNIDETLVKKATWQR